MRHANATVHLLPIVQSNDAWPRHLAIATMPSKPTSLKYGAPIHQLTHFLFLVNFSFTFGVASDLQLLGD